ncbi:phage baseplate assembly protein V [Paludibacterium yongneupense]|uniref:phage baseplate assembly protein V n=1 Tax=Paludibacterium yongneupense TaxID=400061 RepID=UPI001B7FB91B|nr:phage baseplate assembly protein V [Paludibacterium yongneupense]
MNAMRLHASQAQAGFSGTRVGLIADYDPIAYSIKVALQPTMEETGWIPLATPWAGNGWGLALGPMIGAEVEINFDSGRIDAGMAGGQYFNDEDICPGPPSGEAWLVHQTGSYIKLTNDGKANINGAAEVDVAGPTINITATGNANVSAQTVAVSAQGAASITAPSISIGASGQSLLSFVTSLFQALFNGHTHLSNGAGQQTNAPAQQMTDKHMTSTVKGG